MRKHKILLLSLLFSVLFLRSASAQIAPYKGGAGHYTKLIWADEFNGNGSPDTIDWRYEKGYVRNKELQYYTERRGANALLKNGFLQITARNDSLHKDGEVYSITSASLASKKSWTYGRIEVRAKIPSSLGTWPAIWTLGNNRREVGWPMCGEIDILEHVGYMPDTVHFNVHTKKYNHVTKSGRGIKIPYPAVHNNFHIYAIEWFEDRIDWYMDDRKVFTYQNEGTGSDAWPFDKPQYLMLNLAFGGAWGGQRGVNVHSLPQTFLVDYVRVFK